MSGINRAIGFFPKTGHRRKALAWGAALALAGSAFLAAGALADDFSTGWQEVPPEAVTDMLTDTPPPDPQPAPRAEAPAIPESADMAADWVRHEVMGVSFSAPDSFVVGEARDTELVVFRVMYPDGRVAETVEEVQALDDDTLDSLRFFGIRVVLERERAIEREAPGFMDCPLMVLPAGQRFHNCLFEEALDEGDMGSEALGRALVSVARDERDRALYMTIAATDPEDRQAWLAEADRIVASVDMAPHPAFVPAEPDAPADAPAPGILGGLVTLDLPRDRFSVVSHRADNWVAMGAGGFIAVSSGETARRMLAELEAFATPPEIDDAVFFGLDARLLVGPATREMVQQGIMAMIVPDICLPGDTPLVVSVAAPQDFREVALYREVIASIELHLPDDAHACRLDIGTETEVEEPPSNYASRVGLAIDLPITMYVLFDDHDGVLLSQWRELDWHDGFHIGLFSGAESEFTRFGPDQGWVNGDEDRITLGDGTLMRRLALTLDPAHGSGAGLLLMNPEPDAAGRHAMAFILAANRPYIDPQDEARTLRSVAPGARDFFGALPPEAPEGWVRQVRSGLSFALPPDFEQLFADDTELGMARADDLSQIEAPPPGFEATIIGVQLLDAREVAQDMMPVIDRSEVMVEGEHLFYRRDMAISQDGESYRAVTLHSDVTDRRGRHLMLMFVALNPSDEEAALAEFETVLATLRLRPSRRFELPATEMTALDGLFHVTLPPGWQSHFSGRGYRLFASGNDMAMLQAGLPAQAALAMPNAGFAEPPEISDGVFLGVPAQIARGRASPSVHVLGGPMTMVVFERCLPDGGPIVMTVAGGQHWEESDALRPFVEGLRIDLPTDAIACRPDLAAAVAAPTPEPEPAPEPAPPPRREAPREVLDGLAQMDLPREQFTDVYDMPDVWSATIFSGRQVIVGEGTIAFRIGERAHSELERLHGFAEPPVITEESFFGLSTRLVIGPFENDFHDDAVQAIIVPDICLPDDQPLSVTIVSWQGDFRERPFLRDIVASIRWNLPEGAHDCRPVIGVAPAPPAPEPAPPAPEPAPPAPEPAPADPAVPPVAPVPGWASFADPAHGLRVEYPTDLFPTLPPQPDGSLALEGAGAQARLLLLTQPDHFGQGLNGLLAATTGGGLIETLTDMQREVGRDRLEGRRGALTVLRVHLMGERRFHILHLEYPTAEAARYEDAARAIAASLRLDTAAAPPPPTPVPAPAPALPPAPAPAPPIDAFTALQQAAEAGDGEAMRTLAERYADSADPRHDPAQAFVWYERAAREGDPQAMFETGRRLARGQGVPRDDPQAVNWYRHAVERGVPEAMTMLGWMLADGRGAPRDDAEALRLFRQAAAAGHGLAMNHLGVMHREGRIVGRDPAQAVAWFRQAAQVEDAQGMMNLGLALAQGAGTPMDPEGAAFWLGLALRSGNEAVVDHVLQQVGQLPAHSMMALQRMALDAGYYAGAIDGRYGPMTRQALRDFASGH